jgi:hypothetical protein
MSVVILDHELDATLIVDDQDDAREAYEDTVEDAELTPLPEPGPVAGTVEDYFRRVREGPASAGLCDHLLAHRNYARFSGAEFVAECTRNGFPAVLCTNYGEMIDEIRPYRRWIPSLQRPSKMTPDDFIRGLEECLYEIHHGFRPRREPWRTMIKVLEVHREEGRFLLEAPAWSSTVVPLKFRNVPDEIIERLTPGFRCRARVNLGAESLDEIYFCDWQLIP